MNASPSPENIIDALRKSGYLMEQEVATQLEALNFHVWTNWAFQDIDEGKSREIDVRAIKRVAHNEEKQLSAFVEIIAECKNSKNPFVFIGRSKNQTDNRYLPQELIFPIAEYRAWAPNASRLKEKDAFFHLGFDKVHHDFTRDTKAVQFCRIDRKGKNWHANHGGLYDSIFYPLAKAFIAQKGDIPIATRPNDWRYFWLLVPMVITSGDIFYVDSMEADPVPEEIDHVTFKREIRSGKLDGMFAVEFVRQNQLKTFVSNSLGSLIDKMTDLTTNQADFVLSHSIPWEE